jgi:hypothetical protein
MSPCRASAVDRSIGFNFRFDTLRPQVHQAMWMTRKPRLIAIARTGESQHRVRPIAFDIRLRLASYNDIRQLAARK